MRAIKFWSATFLFFAATAFAADETRFEGKWEVVAFSKDGKDDDTWKGATREHTGGKYTMSKEGAKAVSGTMKVDPDKMTIDLMPNEGQYKGKTLLGVYKFGKDESVLIIVFAEPGKDRPTTIGKGEGLTLTYYKRKK